MWRHGMGPGADDRPHPRPDHEIRRARQRGTIVVANRFPNGKNQPSMGGGKEPKQRNHEKVKWVFPF